jgi:hypothetical protein
MAWVRLCPLRIGAEFKTDTGILIVAIYIIPFHFVITPIVTIVVQKSKINAYLYPYLSHSHFEAPFSMTFKMQKITLTL